ncbi:MAG TPA: energy transducer TonB [candidate division Zixibacteria bacterium]|nr:energy transducer TonB [candidate division Zixibacteria bacterium]
MTRKTWVLAIALSALIGAPISSPLRAADTASDRTVVSRVEPEYPELAKRARITGSVKVEAVVSPNGTVRSVKVLGGHPLLGQAAQDAMRRWRYAPAASESTVVVVFNFNHA